MLARLVLWTKKLTLLVPGIRRVYEERNQLRLSVQRGQEELAESRSTVIERLTRMEDAFAASAGRFEALERQQEVVLESVAQQSAALDGLISETNTNFERLKSRLGDVTSENLEEQVAYEELAMCKDIAPRCLFIMGFARSSTTIVEQIVNVSPDALILGEAFFPLQDGRKNFSDWYNNQHIEFENQISKSSHAPAFISSSEHTWWQWLSEASAYYEMIGEKLAFSAYHFSLKSQQDFQQFYEAHFFRSKYIFTIRHPIQCLLSASKLFDRENEIDLLRECVAWLKFVQLWADVIRVFPNTLTLIADELDQSSIAEMENLLGHPLKDAFLLLEKGETRQHALPGDFHRFAKLEADLVQIYDLIRLSTQENPVFLQADQKRTRTANSSAGRKPGTIAVTPKSIGQAWALAEELRGAIEMMLEKSSTGE